MTEQPILVTGATGKTGSRVVSLLREKGIAVRPGSRSARPRFDWADRSTWDAALAGVEAVYLVPHELDPLAKPFVARAAELGVERVVGLSGRGIDTPGYAGANSGAGKLLGDVEEALRGSSLRWTIVRPTWFAQNFSEGFFLDAVLAGELRLPTGDGAATFVDAEDIAAVVVAALTDDIHHEQVYEVSGPRAVTLAEAAAEISEATGRPMKYVPLSHAEFVAELTGHGMSAADAGEFADTVGAIRRGLDHHVSDGVRRALGRPAREFRTFVKTAAANGAWR
ncbi:NAD(P)H-binding protein [Nocardia bovistercoris]|uniref:NAD(P)H-binding protein n=1 Tax=Nocardia bovistercoris TaxID=2785916 RepID=A0A931N5A0_9NOCA|nr:NAD(P)H-binding protein [Nocardia bovistercoris]MBH0779614.1 NAD(P)H-binding protein [Nocardia bovistercoris]